MVLTNYITPLHELYNDDNNNHVFIKREDLIPFSFGGNKVRIAQEYISDLIRQNKNCLIGYGNPKSNLSRALSNLCYINNIECHIVCPLDDDICEKTFNKELSTLCNAKFHICKKSEVSQTIENVMVRCEKKNLNPYYINGNIFGKGNEAIPVKAYFNAYKEIYDFQNKNNISFDYIFLPVGTGMTYAGFLCGVQNYKMKTKIVGISIARDMDLETKIVKEYTDAFCLINNLQEISLSDIIIDSSVICGNYGTYDKNIEKTIIDSYTNFGIQLDPTYTGKAFYGMKKFLCSKQIKNKNVLFIHTGGTPLFFDYIKQKQDIL